jgi:hypothetical protein
MGGARNGFEKRFQFMNLKLNIRLGSMRPLILIVSSALLLSGGRALFAEGESDTLTREYVSMRERPILWPKRALPYKFESRTIWGDGGEFPRWTFLGAVDFELEPYTMFFRQDPTPPSVSVALQHRLIPQLQIHFAVFKPGVFFEKLDELSLRRYLKGVILKNAKSEIRVTMDPTADSTFRFFGMRPFELIYVIEPPEDEDEGEEQDEPVEKPEALVRSESFFVSEEGPLFVIVYQAPESMFEPHMSLVSGVLNGMAAPEESE